MLSETTLAESLTPAEIETLVAVAGNSGHNRLTLDLPAETITIEGDGRVIRFEIDPLRKDALVRGLDPVGSTLEYAGDIRRFEQAFHAANPWLA